MVVVGNVTVESIADWVPEPGGVVSWRPSPAALAEAREAPMDPVPASYIQALHLRNFCAYAARGLRMSRLLITAWNIPGQCDIRDMTYVINAHIRRHNTYHSWFELPDGEQVLRRTIREPARIALLPTKHGEMTSAECQIQAAATPDPTQWDCFRFMIIQRADHFTFCLSVDHVYIDAMLMGVLFAEIHTMYAALAGSKPPIRLGEAGSYHDYCARQHQFTSALTLDSPQVRAWIEFAEHNAGSLPDCQLPLGDVSAPSMIMSQQLLDAQQTAAFESACVAAGVRFCGGVFACAALAEYELIGAETYYGIVPVDTRVGATDFITTGWFIGFVPISVSVDPASFAYTARSAQASFDSGRQLAQVPFDRVLELAPWLRTPQQGSPLLFHLDAGVPPFSAVTNSHLEGLGARVWYDGGTATQLDIRVNRFEKETHVMVLLPNNPVARESVTRYMETLKSVYVSVAESRGQAMALSRITRK
jgi:mycolipenoyl-CoA---2-(long-chain-fatty acyl)-trehalose mycolipenoyltransferase / long-chain-acyl-CoA---trehalose acyltransferase